MGYGYSRVVDHSVENAIEKVTAELAVEGFGILTQIDVQATLKKKLDADFRPYVILGACNPSIAHQALAQEAELGLLLPCNVIVYRSEAGETVVSAIDADRMLSVVGNPDLDEAAQMVNGKLRAAVDRV
jgi:uncharacterized protein (DUF302 family)